MLGKLISETRQVKGPSSNDDESGVGQAPPQPAPGESPSGAQPGDPNWDRRKSP